MRLTIEFDAELWRVRAWWHRMLCHWLGHVEFAPPPPTTWTLLRDDRPRCVRCHVPDPDAPVPPPVRYIFDS